MTRAMVALSTLVRSVRAWLDSIMPDIARCDEPTKYYTSVFIYRVISFDLLLTLTFK